MNTSRRSVLKTGLFGGTILTLAGLGWAASRASRLRPAPSGLQVFDALEYSVLFAVAERVIAPQPHWPALSEVDPVKNADGTLRLESDFVLGDIKKLIRLFESPVAGLLLDGRATPFTALPGAAQDAVLESWRTSRLAVRRTGYIVLRTMIAAAYFGDPRTFGVVGYEGPPKGFHQPDAPVWRGGGEPRPEGNGVFHPDAEDAP
jgi:hypothetical protein